MITNYFRDISDIVKLESDRIRRDFASHKPTSGTNKEEIVSNFLAENLPKKFDISSGLIVSKTGKFSSQADIIIADSLYGCPMYKSKREPIWMVESVYALIEVKSQLSPTTLKDTIEKCKKFKGLNREFRPTVKPVVQDSLFIMWSFESPKPETVKSNIDKAFEGLPIHLRPDFIITPGGIICKSGNYLELISFGHPESDERKKLLKKHGHDLTSLLPNSYELLDLGNNSVLVLMVWLTSWLMSVGNRAPILERYLTLGESYGKRL